MRLRSVRFKRPPYSHGEDAERADLVRDLMSLYGCYLQKCYDMDRGDIVWMARYA
jgi:hypothetical protein